MFLLICTHAHANEFRSIWMSVLVALGVAILAGFALGMIKPLCWPPSRIGQFANWLRPRKLQGGRLEQWSWAAVNIALVALIVSFAVLFIGRFWTYGGPTRRTLFYIRAVDLTSGMSPLTPLFFMSMGFSAWAFFQLRRSAQIDRYVVPPPFPAGADDGPTHGAFARINNLDRSAQEEVHHENVAVRHSKAVVLGGMALFALALGVWLQSLPSVEGFTWDGLFFTGFAALFALNLSILVRLLYLWRRTKRLLDAIALVPMMRAFGRLPTKASALFGKYLFAQRPKLEHLQLPLHELRLLAGAGP